MKRAVATRIANDSGAEVIDVVREAFPVPRGVRPPIDSVFALDEARAAVARLESGRAVGKVIVDPIGSSK